MANVQKTITTCDRCGEFIVREGVLNGLPTGWGEAALRYSITVGSPKDTFGVLCPTCAADVGQRIKRMPTKSGKKE